MFDFYSCLLVAVLWLFHSIELCEFLGKMSHDDWNRQENKNKKHLTRRQRTQSHQSKEDQMRNFNKLLRSVLRSYGLLTTGRNKEKKYFTRHVQCTMPNGNSMDKDSKTSNKNEMEKRKTPKWQREWRHLVKPRRHRIKKHRKWKKRNELNSYTKKAFREWSGHALHNNYGCLNDNNDFNIANNRQEITCCRTKGEKNVDSNWNLNQINIHRDKKERHTHTHTKLGSNEYEEINNVRF